MADLAVGFAKSVVEGTLSKAQAAIEQEGRLRLSAQRDLVFITGEFQMMRSFLKVANAERVENPVVMTWVRQIRDLAFDVEDCIEFVVHLDGKKGWWWRMVPSWCFGPVALPLDEAVDEIEQLKIRVEDVSTRNSRYSLISDTGSKPTSAQEQQPGAEHSSMLVGRTQQGDLAQLLAAKKQGDHLLRVISVWGGTGDDLGVASIIWKAYNEQQTRQHFARRAWVKLTHPVNPHEFVGRLKDHFHASAIARKFKEEGEVRKRNIGLDVLRRRTSESEAQATQQEDSLHWIEQQLDNETYLVVLEGLSTVADWDAVIQFFPPRKKGSCIIVSTQQFQLASLCVGHQYQILDLRPLSSVDRSIYALYKEGSQCVGDQRGKAAAVQGSQHVKHRAAHDWVANNTLVARDSEVNDLGQCITKARSESIQVLSVWGIASVGKSALVKTLFCNRILTDCSTQQADGRSLFHKYAWVDISHPFNLTDFAWSLLFNFDSESLVSEEIIGHPDMGSTNPILECQSILKKNKCLVVIDDIQSTQEWDLIQAHLVSGSHDNCIIIITTEESVARHCRGDKKELMFNVKSLESDSSFRLFRKKVSATKYPLHSNLFDENAADLQELVSMCGGLPEVIVEIANSLGNKSVSQMDHARSLSNKFMHELESNREFDSLQGLFRWLRTYFRICPDDLKPCIFYLSIFPRGFIIRRRRIVRRWIADGYSRDNHEHSAEQNGEKQFSNLLDLSIIQQPPTALGDIRMVSCQVNGFIREYIVSRRMEENLVFELGGNCTLTTQRSGRHLVILENWHRDTIVFHSIDFSRLRSLTVFGKWESFFICQSMKLLRVLDLENASSIKNEDLKNMVKWLCRLKFLSLRGHREILRLPWSLDHLRQLQTLDIKDTSIVTLPKSIVKLQKLQYIRAGTTNNSTSTPPVLSSWFCKDGRRIGVEVPRGIGKLTVLHTLGVVNIVASGEKALVKELKNLTHLHKLGVSGINRDNSVKFFKAIEGHVHLESLAVHLDTNSKGCLDLDGINVPLKNLRSLKLYGLNDDLPAWISGLIKLAKMDLEMVTSLDENSMNLLGQLPELCMLRIKQQQQGASIDENTGVSPSADNKEQQQAGKLQFRVIKNRVEAESFQEVKVLKIACSSNSLDVTFGSETMQNLELLKVDCRGESLQYNFSGLENLEELKEVLLVKGTIAEMLKRQLDRQLEEHPSKVKPVVKLEEPSLSA